MGGQQQLRRGPDLRFALWRFKDGELVMNAARLQGNLQRGHRTLHLHVHCGIRQNPLEFSLHDATGINSKTHQPLTVTIRLVQDLRFDDFLNNVLQGDQPQNLVERISFTLIIHLLNDGQVGFTCEQKHLNMLNTRKTQN